LAQRHLRRSTQYISEILKSDWIVQSDLYFLTLPKLCNVEAWLRPNPSRRIQALRSFRVLVLAASLAVSIVAAVPVHAAGGPGGGGGNPGGGGAVARPVANFKNFRMAGALFSTSTHALTGGMQFTLAPTGHARLVVAYLNSAHLPAGTALDVLADGVKIGTLVTSAQGGVFTMTSGVPHLTLQSRIALEADGKSIASGAFTLGV
jgi:hypothetical protein